MKAYLYCFLTLVVCLSGCREKILPFQEYNAWLADPENGLMKEKTINGIRIGVKYLPPEYQTYNELRANPQEASRRDSITAYYSHSLCFLVRIGTDDEKKKGDIMLDGLESFPQFLERVNELNFNIQRYMSLTIDSTRYTPVLANLENSYGLEKYRNIMVVFLPSSIPGDHSEIDLSFNDEIFGTGLSHFLFDAKDLQNIPRLRF